MVIPGLAAERIEREKNVGRSKTVPFKNNRHNNCSRCKCLVCGEVLLSLTSIHAKRHGYDSKQKMINDRKVKWL